MNNRLPVIGVIVVIVLFLLYSSIFVVNQREQALVLRFGEIVDVKSEPGIYFKLPFSFFDADTVQIIENRLLRFDLDDIRVQVSGGKFYEVDAFLVYSINDPRRFRAAVSGQVMLAEQRLRTRLDAALRRVYGLRGFESALSEDRAEMMREVRDELKPAANSLGIEIADVRIRRTDLTAEVSQQTYDRMKADREVVETIAKAQRESEILRGEGEAERSATFAAAFQKDPEFFEFWRSMNAYTLALDGQGTTMLLSPDSEFFKFFRDASGKAPELKPAPEAPVPPADTGATGSTGATDPAGASTAQQ
jgi:membrane protease subunit HflC